MAGGHHFIPGEYLQSASGRPGTGDPLIGTRIDEYLIVQRLGEGGFGTVYLTLQLPVMLEAALKLLKRVDDSVDANSMKQALGQEASALAKVTHPNIVRLLKYGSLEDRPYMVTEYVREGRELADVMRDGWERGVRLLPADVGHITTQILGALEAAHAVGLVHRDIKPQNVMLQTVNEDTRFVRVLDFGLAKYVGDSGDTSAIRGTPAYMAPEQLVCSNIGPWTDLYAVGILLFELVTGVRAFKGLSASQLYSAKLRPDHDIIRFAGVANLPQPLERVIRTATAIQVEQRFASAREFSTALDTALGDWDGGGPTLDANHDDLGFAPTMETDSDQVTRSTAEPGVPAGRRKTMRNAAIGGIGLAVLTAVLSVVFLVNWPSDGPFLVSPESVGDQLRPDLAPARDGGFLVVWGSAHNPDAGVDIYGRFYQGDSSPAGEPFRINSTTGGEQHNPAAAALAGDAFVVVWNGDRQDDRGWDVQGQILSPHGRQQGAEFVVSHVHQSGDQTLPTVAARPDGQYLVAWQGTGPGDDRGIFAQLFNGPEDYHGTGITVKSEAKTAQRYPDVAAANDGYVVVFEDKSAPGDSDGISVQRIGADGTIVGSLLRANSHVEGKQRYPRVAGLNGGGFVVVWNSAAQDGWGLGVYGQFYDDSSNPVGREIRLNTTTEGDQWTPAVCDGNDGQAMVAWLGDQQDGDSGSVVARFLGNSGSGSDEFLLNTYTTSSQFIRSVCRLSNGRFAAAWESQGEDGDGWGVVATVLGDSGD